MSSLLARVYFGSFFTLLFALSMVFLGTSLLHPSFAVLASLFLFFSTKELLFLLRQKNKSPFDDLCKITSFLFPLVLYADILYMSSPLLTLSFLFLFFIALFAKAIVQFKEPLEQISYTLMPLCYLILPLSSAILIVYFPFKEVSEDGRVWFIFLLLVTKACDIGAYFMGKGFGIKKVAPLLSPQKTYAGVFGGFLFSFLAALFFYSFMEHFFDKMSTPGLKESIVLSLLLSLFAQFGDLSESLIKRDASVKDSSSLPGVGGLLDVLDSLVFSTPFLYIYLLARFS